MRFMKIALENWKNFRSVDVELQQRVFVVGPNASGKSNFLDAFRFLQDLASPGGGLQKAVSERGGISKLRCLAARRYPNVALRVHLGNGDDRSDWYYELEINQDNSRRPVVAKEIVKEGNRTLVSRPDASDESDKERLTQTYLEQVNANKDFRDIADFLLTLRYLVTAQLGTMQGRTDGPARFDSCATKPKRIRRLRHAAGVTRFRRDPTQISVSDTPQLSNYDISTSFRRLSEILALQPTRLDSRCSVGTFWNDWRDRLKSPRTLG